MVPSCWRGTHNVDTDILVQGEQYTIPIVAVSHKTHATYRSSLSMVADDDDFFIQ